MSLVDRIREAAKEERVYKPHPFGVFAARVTDIIHKSLKTGGELYDVHLETSEGRARTSIWRTTHADVEDGYGGTMTLAEAEARYVRSMGRLLRLYTDLGLAEPAGDTEAEIEEGCYERLGELIGKPCEINVQANKKKPDGDPVVYINPPKATVPAVRAKVAAKTSGAKVQRAKPPIDLDVPF